MKDGYASWGLASIHADKPLCHYMLMHCEENRWVPRTVDIGATSAARHVVKVAASA